MADQSLKDALGEPDEGPAEVRLVEADRLVFFSDAVVAIAMTLLALELPVPPADSNAKLLHAMGEHSGEYRAFLISFLVISTHWFGHHRIFGHVTGLGGRVAQWNMCWLLTVVLTPFSTKVLTGDGAFQVRFITYAAVQALAGLFFLLTFHELVRKRLLRDDTPPEAVTGSYVRLIVVSAAFLVSIPVSFFTHWAYACWFTIPFAIRGWLKFTAWREARASAKPAAPVPSRSG
jgi:uncharacterized membrane protein